jgi:hypothetical protein
MNPPEIFFSYAWQGESEALIDQLSAVLAAKGYTITRDKSAMNYKDSIHEFMERIGRGKFILVVVSDKYLKSEYCLYEACRMFQTPALRERIFPLVLPEVDIFSVRGQLTYLKYWETEYGVLEAEYKQLAASSPTLVARLAERLRDLEVTTRFLNDFMALVSDMNVLTSQMHLETNFSALIQALETSMQRLELDDSGANQPEEIQMSNEKKIETGGGDFIGRDKHIGGHETKISIGGSVSGSNIVVGNHNVVTNTSSTQNLFAQVYQEIEKSALSAGEKEDLKAEYQEIETAVTQGAAIDESWLARRLRNLKRMAPAIAEVALSALAGPGAAVAAIVKQVAEKVKTEG